MTSMDTLQLVIQQNKYLINVVSTSTFLVLLLSGIASNMVINIAFMVGLGFETIKRLKIKNSAENIGSLVDLLKCWIILCVVMVCETIIVFIFDATIANVFLNIVKLGIVWVMYPNITMFYDMHIEKWFDKGFDFYTNFCNNEETKTIDNKYDVVSYVKNSVYWIFNRGTTNKKNQ